MGRGGGGGGVVALYPESLQPCTTKLMSSHRLHHRSLAPFVQLHLFIFVLLVSAAVSVALQPHAYAGMMDLISMSSIAFLMFMSLYFIGYDKQPSGAASLGGMYKPLIMSVMIASQVANSITMTGMTFLTLLSLRSSTSVSLWFMLCVTGPLTTTVGAVCLVFDILVIIFMLLFTVTKTRKHFIGCAYELRCYASLALCEP